MFFLQAEALIVFVAETSEELGEWELNALGLALVPSRSAEKVAAASRINRLHLLDAGHQRQVVATRLDLSGGRQDGDAAGGARRFVSRRRQARETRVDINQESSEMALHGVQLRGEVADVAYFDVLWVDTGSLQAPDHGLAQHGDDVLVLLVPVARE